MFWLNVLLSFFIVAFGQPARLPLLGSIAACCGFALFWHAMLQLSNRRDRFWLSLFWFTGVQLIQLSWMSSTQYMGLLILPVYVGVNLALGAQFAVISLWIRPAMSVRSVLAVCGVWVFFEWIRLFLCTGFTWNPVGLAFTCSTYSLQAASFFGIYGLSFWVILVNLVALQAMARLRCWKSWALCASLAACPYLVGICQLSRLEDHSDRSIKALLVQTAVLPEQKDYDPSQASFFIPLKEQWTSIARSIEETLERGARIDLIVLPEGALPYGAYRYIYDLEEIEDVWQQVFGWDALLDLPPLRLPEAHWEKGGWKITNAYWAHALAVRYGADVIIGLDDDGHNAAFLFRPGETMPERYEKRVLVPISEYIPFGQILSSFIAHKYGITQSFIAGTQAKIFQSKVPLAVSICYEETYGEIAREARLQGAELFVNLTNDAWFPCSLLARQHFDHGMIRSVENGVPLLRACNTGVTGGVDCFGRVIQVLPAGESHRGAIVVDVPISTHRTWYTLWGNAAILWISGLCVVLGKRKHCSKFTGSDTFSS